MKKLFIWYTSNNILQLIRVKKMTYKEEININSNIIILSFF